MKMEDSQITKEEKSKINLASKKKKINENFLWI